MMPVLTQELVHTVIDLATKSSRSRPEIEVFSTDDDDSTSIFESTKEEKKLREFIQSLPKPELAELAALMWVGRDYENISEIDEHWELLVNKGLNDLDIAQYVSAKSPLADYLKSGLRKIANSNIRL